MSWHIAHFRVGQKIDEFDYPHHNDYSNLSRELVLRTKRCNDVFIVRSPAGELSELRVQWSSDRVELLFVFPRPNANSDDTLKILRAFIPFVNAGQLGPWVEVKGKFLGRRVENVLTTYDAIDFRTKQYASGVVLGEIDYFTLALLEDGPEPRWHFVVAESVKDYCEQQDIASGLAI